MKRAHKNKLILIFLIAIIVDCYALAADSLKIRYDEVEYNNIFGFAKILKNICNSKEFIKNLKNHQSYPKFGREEDWVKTCHLINQKKFSITEKFFEDNFKLKLISNKEGLLTGYYQPVINVSSNNDGTFKYPILKKNQKYRNKTRKFIENNFDENDVMLWTDDKINLFFLHIQGSGIGKFSNKKRVKINYDGNNNLSYTSIGKYLVKNNYLDKVDVNLFTIKAWLRKNKDKSDDVMNINERFIFFKKDTQNTDSRPIGALGMRLTANYSIAVDKKIYPLGLPFIMERIHTKTLSAVISMDTGAAITGPNRADLFFGEGDDAEKDAGLLKKKIYLYALIPYSK